MTETETLILDSYGSCRRLGMTHGSAVRQVAAAYVTTSKRVNELLTDYAEEMSE